MKGLQLFISLVNQKMPMLRDGFLFLNNLLGSDLKTVEDFNEAMTTLDSLDQMDLIYKIKEI
jgi:hypothetical protein